MSLRSLVITLTGENLYRVPSELYYAGKVWHTITKKATSEHQTGEQDP